MFRSEFRRCGLAAAAALLCCVTLSATSLAQDASPPAVPSTQDVLGEVSALPADSPQLIGSSSGSFAPGSPKDAAAQAAARFLPTVRAALAAGDWDRARRHMLQLALMVGQTHDLKGLEALGEEILDTTEPSGLLATGLLLFDVSREALELKQYLASTVMRRSSFDCLERLESAAGVSRPLVADAYTWIGSELQASRSASASGDSFRRAVKLDPELGPASLGLGLYFDQIGYPDEAIKVYDDMPDVQPYRGEAMLRKAIAQLQAGHERSARRELTALVDPSAASPAEPWVRSVAYQELAMLRLRQDGPQAARDVLQQAVQHLPRERRLYVLLAFVHNTLGRRGAAASVLRDMEAKAEDEVGPSPRHRLAGWRLEVPDDLETRIRERAIAAVATGSTAP